MLTLSEDWSVYHASQTYCICVVRNWASVEERVSRNRLKRRHLLQQMQTEVSNSVVQLLCHLQAFWNYYNTESVPKACLVCLLLQNYFSYNIYIYYLYKYLLYFFKQFVAGFVVGYRQINCFISSDSSIPPMMTASFQEIYLQQQQKLIIYFTKVIEQDKIFI